MAKQHHDPSGLVWIIAGSVLGAVLLVAGLSLGLALFSKPSPQARVAAANREPTPKTEYDAEEREAIALFRNSKASVVNVDTVVIRRGFNRNDVVQAGTGSGFMWDEDGHIVTNYHVIEESLKRGLTLRVVLSDSTEWRTTVVGIAPEFDLAVLRINAGKALLKPIKLGTSKDLEVGQKCYAIGNPFGLSLTLTKGIVSALDREIDSPAGSVIPGVIQTDAPINPGNSGGPLLDRDGRLIGVNTQIATARGGGQGSVGIGFAVPVDAVANVVPQLIRNGKLIKPSLGITLVNPVLLRRAGIATGVMVFSVEADSPAEKAGVQPVVIDPGTGNGSPGDVITRINGDELTDNADYERLAARFKNGDMLTLQLQRGDRALTVEITLPR